MVKLDVKIDEGNTGIIIYIKEREKCCFNKAHELDIGLFRAVDSHVISCKFSKIERVT